MPRKLLLLTGIWLLACTGSEARAAETTAAPKREKPPDVVSKLAANLEPSRRVVYKSAGDRELLLHIFHPKGWQPSDRRPCFVAFHGGGWTSGEPRRMYPYCNHFARRGMVGISAQYRLLKAGQGITVFDSVKDGRSAIRHLKGHAAEFGIDPAQIVACGASAGGHVAAGTALFEEVDDAAAVLEVSSTPAALVLLYPVIDTSAAGYGNAKIGERWRELSPAHNVRGRLPPTLIFHGTGDTVTPFAGAAAFRDAMQQAGNRCELDVYEGGKHGYLIFDEKLYHDTLQKTEKFLSSLELLGNR